MMEIIAAFLTGVVGPIAYFFVASHLAKQKEKKRDSILDGVPKALPALTKAKRIQEKAAGVGFDWEHLDQVYKKVYEEIDELNEAIKSKYSVTCISLYNGLFSARYPICLFVEILFV